MSPSMLRPGPCRALLTSSVLVLLMVIGSIGASAASWSGPSEIERRTPSAMTVDDTGRVHVVSESGQGLRYTTNVSGAWTTIRVSHAGSDREPSVALAGGKVYIAYAIIGDSAERNGGRSVGIYLATNRTGSWVTTRVTGNQGVWPSIKVRAGKVHIAYLAPRGVRYLTDQSGHWTDVRVWTRASSVLSAYYRLGTSLVLDAAGTAHIAFARERAPDEDSSGISNGISYATNASGGWKVRTITASRDRVDRIVLDGTRPVIGFERDEAGGPSFQLASISPHSYTFRTLPGSGHGSFTLDVRDRIEVVRYTAARLTWYAARSGSWLHRTWTTGDTTVAFVRTTGDTTRILFDDCCGNRVEASTTSFLLTRR